ncbi:hypothetical protein ACFX5U_15340 [Sphingobacterium sp. SG20118]|uniref:hypothetical protein n=1 Tax=Sphingobacterium sp. SG20118 TaxID=3367156 RepID=UPI0037DFBEB6
MPWYLYTLTTPPSDPCDPNNYTLYGPTAPPCPGANIYLCAIRALDHMGKPIITAALCAEIIYALQNGIETPNVLLKPI